MKEPDRDEELAAAQAEDADSEDASSPFDHPAFLPVLVFGMACWFGYDGWFNEKIESVRFNRYGFGFLVGAAIYFTLVELKRLPFLFPALLVGYALWLGALDLLGPADAWYKDVESARLFNRYAALGALGLAAIYALREAFGSRRAST
jgi:hypothetical protein